MQGCATESKENNQDNEFLKRQQEHLSFAEAQKLDFPVQLSVGDFKRLIELATKNKRDSLSV
jgi:hypothetical protein